MTEDAHITPRRCLFPAGVQSVQLYHDPVTLDHNLQRCIDMGWHVVDLDASPWETDERLHADLASGLGFPTYYGGNLDALDDAMAGLAEGRYGFPATVAGGAIILRHFDRFMSKNRDSAAALLEIVATAAHRALRFGWPLAVFIYSDDPNLTL